MLTSLYKTQIAFIYYYLKNIIKSTNTSAISIIIINGKIDTMHEPTYLKMS